MSMHETLPVAPETEQREPADEFTIRAYHELQKGFDDKEERERLKAIAISESEKFLSDFGIDLIPEDTYYSPKQDVKAQAHVFRRSTPVIPYSIGGDIPRIGYVLSEDVNAISEDESTTTAYHLKMVNLETGERIGRKSAFYLGVPQEEQQDFAYGASSKAGIDQLNGYLALLQKLRNTMNSQGE